MVQPKKTLFIPLVPLEKLNIHFKLLFESPDYHPARAMLDEVYQDFEDPDGNFLQQFQTTGFDARLFELYLSTYFSRSGFAVDRTHASPDFLVTRNGITASVEATTVNPSQGISSTNESLPSKLDPKALGHFHDQEVPIKFGSPLFSKLQKKYWELEHCKDRPLILAIEAFFNDESLTLSDSPLAQFLYGLRVSASWTNVGTLEVKADTVDSHKSGNKEIPSNFFGQSDTEFISAVVFTNCGTHAKFTRMGFQQGFGTEHFDIGRFGLCYNPDPDAKDPTYFSYSLDEPPLVESWGQGLVVHHNPNALFPLPREFFPEARQGYIENGMHKTDPSGWQPVMSRTRIVHFDRPEHRPYRIPRVSVGAITKGEFANALGIAVERSNPLLVEDGWFSDETESFLGVVVWDETDQDWGYVILARDEHFRFRAIDTGVSIESRDIARSELQLAIAKLLARQQRIFPQ